MRTDSLQTGLPHQARTPLVQWRLADPCWLEWARRAEAAVAGQRGSDVEVLKEARRRLIFRLRQGERSIVVKAFPMGGFRHQFLTHGRYGRAEACSLLEACRRGLPVPGVYGLGLWRRWGFVRCTMVMMEDLAPRRTVRDLLTLAGPDQARCAAILDSTIDLFVNLYLTGCKNIDVNAGSILLTDDLSDLRVIDFQYTRFLDHPSPKALTLQAARFTMTCSKWHEGLPLEPWVCSVLARAGVRHRGRWLNVWRGFHARYVSRWQRMTIY